MDSSTFFSWLCVSSLCHALTCRLGALLCLSILNTQNKPLFCCAGMLCCDEKMLKSQCKGSFSQEQNLPSSPAGWVPESSGKHLLRVTQIELLSPEVQAWMRGFRSLRMISCSPATPHSTAQRCRDEWSWTGAAPQLQMERKRAISDLLVLRFDLKPSWCKFGTIPSEATNLLWICATAPHRGLSQSNQTLFFFSPLSFSKLSGKEREPLF